MISGLFDSPFIDVLLIILLLRWFVPSLFRIRAPVKEKKQQEREIIRNANEQQQKFSKEEGEYIDYEEIK